MTLLTFFHSGSSQYPLSHEYRLHCTLGLPGNHTLCFVLTEEDHCARPLQKPPISSVIVIFISDYVGPNPRCVSTSSIGFSSSGTNFSRSHLILS